MRISAYGQDGHQQSYRRKSGGMISETENGSPETGCTGRSWQSMWHVRKKTFAAVGMGGSKVETAFQKERAKDVAVTNT